VNLKSTALWSALAAVISLANSFISVKLVAVIIGPSGVGRVGQLSNFNAILMTIALGGVSTGIIKYTAEFKDNIVELRKIWQTASSISLVLIAVIAMGLILFHNLLSIQILHSTQYGSIFVVLAFSLFFYVANTFLLNILNGLHLIKRFTVLNMINNCTGLLVTLLLVNFLRLYGALLALVTVQSVTFLVIVTFVSRQDWFKLGNFFGKIDCKYLRLLLAFTVMALVNLCVSPLSQMLIRGYLVDHTSWDIAGCWQGMQKISDSYLMIVYTALGTYYLPKLSATQCKIRIHNEIMNGYKLVMPLVIVSATVIYLCRDLVIHILFAKSFGAMRGMFFWQLFGDVFKVASFLIGYLLVAKSKVKLYAIVQVLFGVTLLWLSYLFISFNGADGAVQAFCLNYLLFFVFMVYIYKKGILV
jgi:O-antigen/teichoic acid export membrane protein